MLPTCCCSGSSTQDSDARLAMGLAHVSLTFNAVTDSDSASRFQALID